MFRLKQFLIWTTIFIAVIATGMHYYQHILAVPHKTIISFAFLVLITSIMMSYKMLPVRTASDTYVGHTDNKGVEFPDVMCG